MEGPPKPLEIPRITFFSWILPNIMGVQATALKWPTSRNRAPLEHKLVVRSGYFCSCDADVRHCHCWTGVVQRLADHLD